METVTFCGVCHATRGLTAGHRAGWNSPADDDNHERVSHDLSEPAPGPNSRGRPQHNPDPETGIGRWKDDEIATAIREGGGQTARSSDPPMPIALYRDLSDNDLTAMVAYLRTVPPVRNGGHRTLDLSHCAGALRAACRACCRTLPIILLRVVPTSRGHWRIARVPHSPLGLVRSEIGRARARAGRRSRATFGFVVASMSPRTRNTVSERGLMIR